MKLCRSFPKEFKEFQFSPWTNFRCKKVDQSTNQPKHRTIKCLTVVLSSTDRSPVNKMRFADQIDQIDQIRSCFSGMIFTNHFSASSTIGKPLRMMMMQRTPASVCWNESDFIQRMEMVRSKLKKRAVSTLIFLRLYSVYFFNKKQFLREKNGQKRKKCPIEAKMTGKNIYTGSKITELE